MLTGFYHNHKYLRIYSNDKYDAQYRLVHSTGNGEFPYTFNANYSPSGRLGNKFTSAKPFATDALFGYDRQRMTHQPRTLFDPYVGTLDLYWDANGNLAQMIDCMQNSGRLHEWDVKRNSRTEKSPVDSSQSKCGARVCQSKHRTQLDRLRFVLGEKFAGYFGYDANGERAFFIFRFQNIEIWRLFCFFLLYLKKVKVFHDFSCVFEKNVVPLHREKCIEYKNMHHGECKLN